MSTWTHHRARVASLSRDREPDDPELLEARRELQAARFGDRIHDEASKAVDATDDPDAWANRVAASLPPLTPAEAAAVGKLAAALDARRTGAPNAAATA